MTTHIKNGEPLIFRRFALPFSAFEYLKECQRRLTIGTLLSPQPNNNEVLTRILMEHRAMMINQMNILSEEHNNGNEAGAERPSN